MPSKLNMRNQYNKFHWDICGHQKITDFLQSAITNQKIAQAYLFVGPAGLGKNAIAQEFIASIFCQEKEGMVPCGECVHCQQIGHKVHPDVYRLDRLVDEKTGRLKKDITVDQVRDLKIKMQQATLLNDYKAALIPEAQFLNENSANALLKLLEEPTAKTVIILIAEDIKKMLQTIVSRCQVIKFLPVATKEIELYLTKKSSGAAIKEIARLAYGRPGLAMSFLTDQENLKNYLSDVSNFFKIIGANLNERFDLAGDLIDWTKDESVNSQKINKLFDHWQSILRDLTLADSANEPLIVNLNQLAAIKKYQSLWPPSKIKKILKSLHQAKIYFRQNLNTRTVLEHLIINF